MSDISKLKVDNATYDIKDASARQEIHPKPITKAAYDQLTQQEKEAHRYIITDFPDGDIIDLSTSTATGNPLSFTTDSEQAARSCVITFEPIQSGSGDPSPSNIREISGYDKVELAVPRKNLIPITLQSLKTINTNGTWNNNVYDWCGITFTISTDDNGFVNEIVYSGTASTGFDFQVASGLSFAAGNYYLNGGGNGGGSSSTGTWRLVWYRGSSSTQSYDLTTDNLATLDSDINGSYLNIHFFNGAVASNVVAKPMIRLASITDGTYEPYNPATSISEPIPETIYGGTLDVESGELVVDKGIVDLGSLTWSWNSGNSGRFYADITGAKINDNARTGYGMASSYKVLMNGESTSDITNNDAYFGSNNAYFYVHDNRYGQSTVADFTAAVTGQKLVYKLATPYTIQLTPHQVKLLQGANVVTTNGTSIALTYRNGEVASLADVSSVAEFAKNLDSRKPIVIHTAAANQTFAAQLAELYPYIEGLSDEQLYRSAILSGVNQIFRCSDIYNRVFGFLFTLNSGIRMIGIRMTAANNCKIFKTDIKTDGTVTTTDEINTVNTFKLSIVLL